MDDPDAKESLDYLIEVIAEYEKMVLNIGKNGLSASLLLNYRDEIQSTMHELREMEVDLREYWFKLVTLDNGLRKQAQKFVDEVGHTNFKQYQIINNPPADHWWWYLNKTTQPPRDEKKGWKFWKK